MRERNEGMIVVTGFARSGTSMVMQTLNLLGVPMPAPAFIPENEPIREFNPKGYYELHLTSGIEDDCYKGQAVKLFGGQLVRTPESLISRLIFIDRNKQDALTSFHKVMHLVCPANISGEEVYQANRRCIRERVTEQTMCVNYEQVCEQPAKFVSDLILYLQLQVTEDQKQQAIDNIKK